MTQSQCLSFLEYMPSQFVWNDATFALVRILTSGHTHHHHFVRKWENFKVTPCLIFAGFFWVEGEGVCKVLGCKGLCNRWSYFPLRTAKRLGSLSETQERQKTQRAHSPSVAFPIISHTHTHTRSFLYIYSVQHRLPLSFFEVFDYMYHLISFRFVPLLLPFFFYRRKPLRIK